MNSTQKQTALTLMWGSLVALLMLGCAKSGVEVTVASSGAGSVQSFKRIAPGGQEISELKLCVTRVKLVGASDSTANPSASDDSSDSSAAETEVEFSPGLVNALEAKDWGTINVPAGFRMKALKIKIHRDENLCPGIEGSMVVNGITIHPDIEFRWKFEPAVAIDGTTKTLVLSFDKVKQALEDAYDQWHGSPDSIKSVIEGIHGEAGTLAE